MSKLSFPSVAMSELVDRVAHPVDVDLATMYEQIGVRSHGKGLFYKERVSGETLGNKRVFWVEPDCFVVNIVFAWEGAIARTTESDRGKIASHRFPMYRPKEGRVKLDYLTYLFKTELGKYLLGLASPGGAGRNKTLGQSEFLRIEIPCPPIAEQTGIVEILSTWDSAIVATKKLISSTRLQQQEMVRVLLDPYAGSTAAGWKALTLSQLGEFYSGVTYAPRDVVGSDGLLVLRSSNVQNGLITLGDNVYVDPGVRIGTLTEVGDIIICVRNGSRSLIGKSAQIDQNSVGLAHGAFMSLFRPKQPDFCRHLFKTSRFNKLVSQNLGATINSINTSDLRNFSFVLPPKDKWTEIGRILSAHERAIELLDGQLRSLVDERLALMQQLLTGKRRVNGVKEAA